MKKSFRFFIVVIGAMMGWLWFWHKRYGDHHFHHVSIRPFEIDGRMGTRLVIQSILPCKPAAAWAKVTTPALLAHVSRPLLGFEMRDGSPLPETWRPNVSYPLTLTGLNFLPLGNHEITLVDIDAEKMRLQSDEKGTLVNVWRHLIQLAPYENGQTLYIDQVDLEAGDLTPFVALFASLFYRHRQRQWQDLAVNLGS